MKKPKDNLSSVKRLDLIWYCFAIIYLVIVTDYFRNISVLFLTPFIILLAVIGILYGIIKVVFLRSGKILKLTPLGKIKIGIYVFVSIAIAILYLIDFNLPWIYRLPFVLICLFSAFLNGLSLYKGVSLAFYHWVDQKIGRSFRKLVIGE